MRKYRKAIAALALASLGQGCTHHETFVQTEQAALGRVVIYRNGIAYYERRAQVDGDHLTLRVPADKIDDFLKSLTVADAKTGQALPVSFPSPGRASGDQVEMSIQLPDRGHRDIVLSYVTESPAWKPSYRVMVGEAGRIDIQGWAIVDNTSGEDWKAVQVGVGSSSALSFRFDLHSIRVVHRETLHSQESFAKAPPTGGSVVRTGQESENVLAQLDDMDIPRPDGHPDVALDIAFGGEERSWDKKKDSRSSASGAGDKGHGYLAAKSAPANEPAAQRYRKVPTNNKELQGDNRVNALAESLKNRRQTVVIEGYAAAGEADAQDRALDRANMLRNQLIEQGVPPSQLKVAGRGVVAGQKAGVRLVESKNTADESKKSSDPEEIAGNPVGESHFESTRPMTVAKGTSAMVSMVQAQAIGDIVYLYDAESGRGDSRFAFRAVRFKNPTGSTLETGPMTVYGAGRFVGEGLTEPIPAGAVAVVPFALDRQVVVDRDGSTGDRMSQLLKVNRGVMTAEVQHWKRTRLKITNRLGTANIVLVRHTVPKGWSLTDSPKVAEQYGDSRLFAVELKGGETKTVEIEEATPLTRTVDLRTPVGVDLVRVWLDMGKPDAQAAASMKKLLGLYNEMAKAQEMIEHLRERGEEFRMRSDELHGQIFSLKAVRTGGSLMAHLQQKMKEMSDKVQGNTLAVVQMQEKLMLARVRFQDELAELTLDHKTAAQTAQN